ncbi:MAG: Phosphoglycerate kinase [Candidatus Uhrbacteria bacterium GW2011_GWE2_40_58]|nr:MAG: Phosphoglycerate kinase [Candidatus Uhrbacteria bacterium GW2011_GWF2_40_263]KKR68272.1 MAG: Phosphoglycerate kinase [Candidatus Uhrbacteria bacterium GW2011_GWE2_40_58]OGL97531.1 MAG: phosphoglycerate kinase [Candidatus Uhrbacteria bacterium RIFOXYB2_FULL_41_18]HBK35080.1 phosphoglycerate kinase [Candidatus Uhrbacteria bacterium]HCB56279.1 phosphoglycerate kinase [Candidatus Uhrbacteria bacterium]
MRLRTLRNNMNLRGKRVIIRIDANVPIHKGKVVDGPQGRIARAAVDIDWLSQRGAKVIVISHLGRPGGKRVSAFSLRPVARRLSELLRVQVKFTREIVGEKVKKQIDLMKEGEVLLLENIRFDVREKENSPEFAQALAGLGDLYVNDAFSVSHRDHTSVDAITAELPSYAGPTLVQEVSVLSRVLRHPKNPFVLAIGGLKMNTKLPVLERLLPSVQTVLVGGALAHAFLKAQGYSIGTSVYDKEGVDVAKKLLEKAKKKIILPDDVVVARSFRKDARTHIVPVSEIGPKDRIVDIGPKTIERFTTFLNQARTIVWNGPFGYCEIDTFCTGTYTLAKVIAKRTGKSMTIVGGGDTGPVIETAGLADQFTLLSTGGGAMLTYLAGDTMNAIEALQL